MSDKISPQDKALFRQAIANIPAQQRKKMQPSTAALPLERETQATDKILSPSDSVFFARPSVGKQEIKQLKQGKFSVESSCDLHGLTQAQASDYLQGFIKESLAHGYQVVHIVHGKGYRSAEQQPVLKNLVNYELRQYVDVLAFCSATATDGGNGAVYVLLRKS